MWLQTLTARARLPAEKRHRRLEAGDQPQTLLPAAGQQGWLLYSLAAQVLPQALLLAAG
jgi:hypothetical protein